MKTDAGTILWLTRASTLKLTPTTAKATRLARSAMASFWSADSSSRSVTLEEVFMLGYSIPELQVTYVYSN